MTELEIQGSYPISSGSESESGYPQATGSEGWSCTGCGAFVPWNESHTCPAFSTYIYKPAIITPLSEMALAVELKRIADALEKIERKMR